MVLPLLKDMGELVQWSHDLRVPMWACTMALLKQQGIKVKKSKPLQYRVTMAHLRYQQLAATIAALPPV